MCSDGITLTFVDEDLKINKTLQDSCVHEDSAEPIPIPFTSDVLRRVQMFTALRSMSGSVRSKWDPLTVPELRLLGPNLPGRVELCNAANFLNNNDLLQLAAKGIAQLIS